MSSTPRLLQLRFVTGNHLREHGNTAKNMENLGWPPLSNRKSRLKSSMFYNKIRNDLICIPCEESIPNPRKPDQYVYPSSKINSHLGSFYPSTIRLWNSINSELKFNPSFDGFKDSLVNITFVSSILRYHSRDCIFWHTSAIINSETKHYFYSINIRLRQVYFTEAMPLFTIL